MALHIDEINIQVRHTFRNNSLSGPSHNDCKKIANSMLMFLITTLTGAERSINLCSKPVCNLNSEYLHRTLISCLSKAKECGYEVLPIIFDGASTNMKVVKELLKQVNEKNEEPSSIAELKLKINFQYENRSYYVMLCIVHIIKNIRNALVKKQNDFYYPRLRLSTGHVLEEGICSAKWMRELHKMNKNKIISSFRMNRNIAYVDNLSKQKVSPALALFSRELTVALKKEFGDNAKGTYEFLKTMNDYAMQPLLTATTLKGYKIIEASVFNCKTDVRLQCFCEISSWLTDEWFPHLKKLPVNCNNTISKNASSNDATNHTTLFDCDLESCEDLICNFWTMKNSQSIIQVMMITKILMLATMTTKQK